MPQKYPKGWDWEKQAKPNSLSMHGMAPDRIGFYELGFMRHGVFEAQYCGRAMGITLRERLKQHYMHSHNANVRANAASLYYRCKALSTPEIAAYVEAVHIAAMDYPWNKRNEWAQHWALET